MSLDSEYRKSDHPLIEKVLNMIQSKSSIDPSYKDAIGNVINASEEIWSLSQIKRFTDHSVKHSERVLNIALNITKGLQIKLNKREMFVLVAACYLHDIGMQWGNFCEKSEEDGASLEEWNEIRQCHAERSVSMIKALLGDRNELAKMNGFRPSLTPILRYLDSIQLFSATLSNDLSAIVLAHTKDSKKKETGWNLVFNSPIHDQFRLDLLAALLRYADELDMGRFRIHDFNMFDKKEIPLSSLEYWFGCSLIDHVKMDVKGSLVIINLQPDYNLIPKSPEMQDFAFFLIFNQYKKLIRSLTKPFIPALPSISETFSKYGLGIRIATLDFSQQGMLDEDTFMTDEYLKQFNRLYKKTSIDTVIADTFSLNFFSFPVLPNTKICLVQESNGLRLPKNVKDKVKKWVQDESNMASKGMNVHVAFHRINKGKSYIEEFLPDQKQAPLSVLGIAGATKANKFDLTNITILPNNIRCKSYLSRDIVTIQFPEFSRTIDWSISPERSVGPWDIILIKYSLNKESEFESVVYGLLTSLGETTFVTIPTDQNIDGISIPDCDDKIMKGAGILEFFYDYTDNNQISEEWKNARTELLSEISKRVKKDRNIKGSLVCSIIGFMEDSKTYRVTTWRDNNIIVPDYIHVGIVASALYLILDKGKETLCENIPFIRPEIFPEKNKAILQLGDFQNTDKISISATNNKASVEIKVDQDAEYKIRQLS